MVRGEMPLEPRASWFSPKCVEAQQLTGPSRGKALFQYEAKSRVLDLNTPIKVKVKVRRWGIRSRGKQPRSSAKAPK
jgi:hypothetical protein